jgi:thiol:disulfide interchange protein
MVFLGLHFTQASTPASQGKLTRVVYITLSKACGCMKDKCLAGDLAVDKAFAGERQGLLKRIDYSTDKDSAREYIKKYRLTMPPSLLFLDAQGNLLWRADGDVDYDAVMAKLKELGV